MNWRSAAMLLPLMLLLDGTQGMEESERLNLRVEAEDMFFHAFNAYMEVAWPADELMPLSCKGRYRGREFGRGDIDDALGNFSLTLVDSLDMLVVLGKVDLFEEAVLKVVETVSFDTDVVVSVFETNIRIVGGLVSGHVLSEYVRDKYGRMEWYRGQLLNMAVDVGNRLLPAFNSTTGLPFPRVNLKTGLKGVDPLQLTCTACAGSMILEFAALSRLSGEKIFEEKASKAMDYLWAARHRQSNLVGNVLNVNTGDWVRRDSGVGAGIDSYYEYVAKAYVLLGEDKYLDRWNTHYTAIMKYLNTGPLMTDVHMHRPTTNSKHFTDALGAFWPGLQVLMGDLKPAIEQHEILYQITKKHHFLPEAITSDFQVHWGQHFLRPEFVESTYFLYKATKDPHYLEVGKKVLKALQKHARVTCGYAAVKDVRTMKHEDRMDSFVLSETFKYLYLLFSKDEELFLDINQFVFTTEAHLLPLSLARLSNSTVVPVEDEYHEFLDADEDVEFAQACPSTRYMFPDHLSTVEAAASVRKPLDNVVEDASPKQRIIKRRLLASEFQSGNQEHIKLVKEMGINLMSLPDGRVQLLHTFANANTQEDAEEGLIFMQEMIELSKQSSSGDSPPKQVRYRVDGRTVILQAGPAQFGLTLRAGSEVTGKVVMASDSKACVGSLQNGESMLSKIVVVDRGDCMFIEKARVLQTLGAKGGIVLDNTEGTAAATSPIFAMSGDGSEDVTIPMVFLFQQEADQLIQAMSDNPDLEITLEEKPLSQESDFVSSSGVSESEPTARETKSPVHAFIERNFQEAESPESDYISVKTDSNTGEIISESVRTIRKQDGSSKTFKTIEKLKKGEIETLRSVGEARIMKLEDMNNTEDAEKTNDTTEEYLDEDDEEELIPELIGSVLNANNENVEDVDDADELTEVDEDSDGDEDADKPEKEKDVSSRPVNLQAFLEPASDVIRGLVDDMMMNDPEALGQLLRIKFTDLMDGFQQIFLQSSSLEDAYRNLFQQVKELGAEEFIKRTKLTRTEKIIKKKNPSEEILAEMIRKHGGQATKVAKLLGDEKISELMAEYLDNVQNSNKKDRIELLSRLELMLEELVEAAAEDQDPL